AGAEVSVQRGPSLQLELPGQRGLPGFMDCDIRPVGTLSDWQDQIFARQYAGIPFGTAHDAGYTGVHLCGVYGAGHVGCSAESNIGILATYRHTRLRFDLGRIHWT